MSYLYFKKLKVFQFFISKFTEKKALKKKHQKQFNFYLKYFFQLKTMYIGNL